jgi:polysaccharide deacetylase 2 family uncharacterized protein YibQ
LSWRIGNEPQKAAAVGPRKGHPSERPVRPRTFHWDWLYGIPLACILGALVFASLLALSDPELSRRLTANEPGADAPALRGDWITDFPERIEAVTAALETLPVPLSRPSEEAQGADRVRWRHRRYEATMPQPDMPGAIETIFAPLGDSARGVVVRVTEHPAGAQVRIGIDGLLTHSVAVQWLGRRPRAAIVVDGLGTNLLQARQLAEVDAPLTFSVRPFQPFSPEVAEIARLFGRQVLVQLPVAGDDAAGSGLALTSTASRDAIVETVTQSLAALPKAVGVNAGGAAALPDRERLRWVLERLKEDALFVIGGDGRASSGTCEMALTVGVPCVDHALVVEAEPDPHAITERIERLAQLARTRGDAIAIVYPGSATVEALHAAVPALVASGVDLVPASMIVLTQSLSTQ